MEKTVRCEDCGRFDVVLYRSAPKGEDPHWKCEHCLRIKGKVPPPDVKEFSEAVYNGLKAREGK